MRITAAQMARWRKLEDEHSKSKARQEQIVRDHVRAHGIHYYPALMRMEQLLKRKYG